jgi:VanZ family protein
MLKIFFASAALAHAALIFYLSHQPSVPVPPLFPHQDKAFHFVAYGMLGFFLSGASGGRKFFWMAALASLYGVSDEIHQMYVPGRDASVVDWLADTAGGFCGAWFCGFLGNRYFPKVPATDISI